MSIPAGKSSMRITVCVDPDLEDLIPTFLANRHKDIQILQACYSNKDFATIAILGHRMKGDGGGYGFTAITEIGAALELAAGRHDPPAIEHLTAELKDYLARVEVVFTKHYHA